MAYRFTTTADPDPFEEREDGANGAWAIAFAAAQKAEELSESGRSARFSIDEHLSATDPHPGQAILREVGVEDDAVLAWRPGTGWELLLSGEDRRSALIDLYLPICSATRTHPI